jgi:uncharacterized membrane protein (UPF0127 family)
VVGLVLITVGVLGLVVFQLGVLPVPAGDTTETQLRVTDCAGAEKATVSADVADSWASQYVGLSRTDSLGQNEGLLFAFDDEQSRTIEMRTMNFGLDVVFIGANGTIQSIETLAAPDSPLEYYLLHDSTTGRGQYVLEVNAGWSASHGVTPGDCVRGLP